MQQHETSQPPSQSLPQIQVDVPTTGEPKTSHKNALSEEVSVGIADYLNHVCAPLVAEVPYPIRREWRAELQAHLEALTLAHIELGAEPEAAVTAAIRQCGKPRGVAVHLLRDWRRAEGRQQSASPVSATLSALGVCGIALLFTGWLDMYPPIQSPWCIAVITALGAVAAGMVTAALVRAHTMRALCSAVCITGFAFLAVFTLLQGLKTALPIAVIALFCGLTFTILGAHIESRAHRLRRAFQRWPGRRTRLTA